MRGRGADAAMPWLRVGSLACVVALLLGIRTAIPAPEAQRDALLIVALGLGYGHQLGALLFGRWRRRALGDRLLRCATLLSACCAFGLALVSFSPTLLLVPLALLAAWHVLENELASRRAAPGSTRLPPLPRAWRAQAAALGGALALVLALILATRFAPWFVAAGVPVWLVLWDPEEVMSALLLHHTLVWLGRSLLRTPERRVAIVLVHALPLLALSGALALGPVALALAASPVLYLSLSAVHAFHTCLERGLEPG